MDKEIEMERNWVLTVEYCDGKWEEFREWSVDYGPYTRKEAFHIKVKFNMAFNKPKQTNFGCLTLRKLEPKDHLDILADVNEMYKHRDPF
jgi:hypothetical protein